MKAYVFPGQGSQHSGMGKGLYDNFPEARKIFNTADEILGYSISAIMFSGTEEELKQTKHTQLAMFLHGYAAYKCLNAGLPDMVAGHSLGEYTALTSSGCLSFEDAVSLVEKRAAAMQKACEKQESGMAAVIKFDRQIIEDICASITDDVVVAANYNSPQQTVISGSLAGLDKAIDKLRAEGATKILKLNVSGAFHSPLMQSAQDELAEAIKDCSFNSPCCPVYQNVTAQPTDDPETIRKNLIAQLTSPVRWTDIVNNMISDGADTFVEFGPSVLKALISRTNPNVTIENIGSEM